MTNTPGPARSSVGKTAPTTTTSASHHGVTDGVRGASHGDRGSAGSAGRNESGKPNEKSTSCQILARVGSNVSAGLLIFLPIVTLAVLVTQGMFDRLVVSVNTQTTGLYWANYGKSCVLAASGWVPNTGSCDAASSAVTPAPAFAAIGTAMAQQLAAEMAEAGGTLHITTCIIGGTAAVGWANLQFVVGYDYFPDCLPTAPQDVAGMAMLETTIRDNHADGLYFLTLYSDLDPTMTILSYANSDGTFQNVMANPKRTLFTASGGIETDSLGGDYIIFSRPLGERYRVMGYCLTEIEELSQVRGTYGLTGWSQGKHSKHPVAPGWACGHKVQNSAELIGLQVAFSICTLLLFAGDVFVTFEGEGCRGVLQGKPVLTYAVLAGLERRKCLVLFIVLNSMPGLLYADVSRIYYFTTNGYKIWGLSCIMVANFFSFGVVFVLSLLDMLPFRLDYVIGYSAPLFLYSAIVAITAASCSDVLYQSAYNKFYAASPYLSTTTVVIVDTDSSSCSSPFLVALHVNDADWPSGSYTAEGTPPVVTLLASAIAPPLGIALGVSIAVASMLHWRAHNSLALYIGWSKTNSFLLFARVPNLITALPLEQDNAIKIGNKCYCKPSTQALMGFATVEPFVADANAVVPANTTAKHNAEVYRVISIYSLIPALVWPQFVPLDGKIEHHQFKAVEAATTLDAAKRFRHTRGDCVS
ncbi:Aste57867_24220 [Aphanomyces stellatus]|uniref:Aste57867_24220 protein n=1 Tax=Aphanomyces stellatus TaxID=120398 RepID=A0A485LPT6_9STRA|nr:hypothetical protein As57867_024145 [Aphanomyces stellatus]VFU00861.1 Aste57867_24220 [Aphanomyces stellatus]